MRKKKQFAISPPPYEHPFCGRIRTINQATHTRDPVNSLDEAEDEIPSCSRDGNNSLTFIIRYPEWNYNRRNYRLWRKTKN